MITINNNTITGRNIIISNGKVIVDGVDVTPDSKEITIQVTGNIENLQVDYAKEVAVYGTVAYLKNGSGDISCHRIVRGVTSGSGDIECDVIEGDVNTGSGDVKCNTITGSVKTGSGSIKYKKTE